MRAALVVWGGWEGHEPRECAEIISEGLDERGFSVTRKNALDVFDDARLLRTFDLIVPCWTMGSLTKQQEENIVGVIQEGSGLGGFHGGMGDAFRGSIKFQWMAGGQFVSHPGGVKDYEVEIVDRSDPITEAMDRFQVRTEQYYMLVDPANHVLATTTFQSANEPWISGVVMPVVWKKYHGRGRIFYSALGHCAREFRDCPQQLEITLRGLEWAARR